MGVNVVSIASTTVILTLNKNEHCHLCASSGLCAFENVLATNVSRDMLQSLSLHFSQYFALFLSSHTGSRDNDHIMVFLSFIFILFFNHKHTHDASNIMVRVLFIIPPTYLIQNSILTSQHKKQWVRARQCLLFVSRRLWKWYNLILLKW